MRTFFALAALAANVATVALVILGFRWRRGDRTKKSPLEFLRGTTLWLAGGVALAATLGSLYLSEIARLIPCKLCWYQRIAMYPTAIILLIAAARRDGKVRMYAATLATIGAAIAVWHRLIQAYPSLESGSCSAIGPPCSAPYIVQFGFVTIPYMALSAFLLILALLWVDRLHELEPESGDSTASESISEEEGQ